MKNVAIIVYTKDLEIKNMKNKLNIFSQKGFTLIELLVVIGIIGILAAGLLAAIDPLEQFRKGRDANTKTAASELLTALQRYYAVRGVFPWANSALSGDECMGAPDTSPTADMMTAALPFRTCLDTLIQLGELKPSFTNQIDLLRELRVSDRTEGEDARTVVCFNPQSKADSQDVRMTRFDATGVETPGVTTHWCVM